MTSSGLNLPALQTLQNELNDESAFRPSGEFGTLRLTLCDDTQKYRINIQKSIIDNVFITTE
jgi:hypothetical protein